MGDTDFERAVHTLLQARDAIAEGRIDAPAQLIPSDYHGLALALEQAQRESVILEEKVALLEAINRSHTVANALLEQEIALLEQERHMEEVGFESWNETDPGYSGRRRTGTYTGRRIIVTVTHADGEEVDASIGLPEGWGLYRLVEGGA